jgi:superoxide dismutase, Cu-Zn family
MKALASLSAIAVLAGCQMMSGGGDAPRATAQLEATKGNKTFGEATFEQRGDKVHAVIYVQGLKPDQEHGLHIHEVGDCSSGDGMSTKGHFNPFGKPHGKPNSAERHAGDMPAIKGEKNGRGKVDVQLDTITVTPGPASIIGKAVIVHAAPDDYTTQPTGNAGARLACGVIKGG